MVKVRHSEARCVSSARRDLCGGEEQSSSTATIRVGRNGEEWLPSSNSIPPPWIVWLGVPFKMPVSRGARIVSRKPLAHSVADTVVEGAAFCRRQRNPVPPEEVFSLRRLWQNRRLHAKIRRGVPLQSGPWRKLSPSTSTTTTAQLGPLHGQKMLTKSWPSSTASTRERSRLPVGRTSDP
jgi:hypothetical protein